MTTPHRSRYGSPLHRLLLRDTAAAAMRLLGLTSRPKPTSGLLTVVTFHRVLPQELIEVYPFPGLCVTPEELGWLLDYFQRYFVCGTFRDTADLHRQGAPVEKPLLAITFDDGQIDNAEFGAPVLEQKSVPATFFIPVAGVEQGRPLWHDTLGFSLVQLANGRLGDLHRVLQRLGLPAPTGVPTEAVVEAAISAAKSMPQSDLCDLVEAVSALGDAPVPAWAGMMSWDDVRALDAAGHEIGSHSMTHGILTACDSAELDYEIRQSKRRLDGIVGHVSSFCYPNGDYDDRCFQILEDCGYRRACTTEWGTNDIGCPRFAYRRFDMDARRVRSWRGHLSSAVLMWRMSSSFAKRMKA